MNDDDDARPTDGEPVLLAGGNPQIAKGDGDDPVEAYLAALPGWKHDVGARVDRLVGAALPGVRRAVRWNSPFYGAEGGTSWFMSFHCVTKYVKVAFFDGSSLDPIPPVGSKDPTTRYLHLREDDEIDADQFVSWVEQAARLPGWGGA